MTHSPEFLRGALAELSRQTTATIDVVLDPGIMFGALLDLDLYQGVLQFPPPGTQRRLIVRSSGSLIDEQRSKFTLLPVEALATWDTGLTNTSMPSSIFISDRKLGVRIWTHDMDGRVGGFEWVDSAAGVAALAREFDELWASRAGFSGLYDAGVPFANESNCRELIEVVHASWDRVLRDIATRPHSIHDLTPRQFEEFMAELLEREGMNVTLTPPSKDGGYDILATSKSQFGSHLYLVECKRYAPNRPVGVELVRNLYGLVEQKGATAGILATTSRFTKGAIEWGGTVLPRMTLKDFESISHWVRSVAAR